MIDKFINKEKTILSLYSGTGAWEKPYVEAGYNVISITLPGNDVRTYTPPDNVYGILAAPPCTMFSLARTTAKTPRDFREGMELVIACLNIIWECRYKNKLTFWALENPRGYLRQFLGNPYFSYKRCWFGDDGGKPTDLWGFFNIPKHNNTIKPIKGRDNTESRWYNSVNGNPKKRAITPPGFAQAFYKSNK